MSSLSDSVWERRPWSSRGKKTMSANLYALMVCLWTALGIAASAIAASLTQGWTLNWQFLLLVLLISIFGIYLGAKSEKPLLSLFGYLLVAVPFGMMLGPVVATYTQASVVGVLFVTTSMVVVLGVVGALVPKDLEGWGSYLFGALLLLLVGYFILPIAGMLGIPINHALNWMDWIGIVVFSFYVVYDWNRAMRIPYTLDNSIDCALAIYLDFINIFIRLLRLMGKKND